MKILGRKSVMISNKDFTSLSEHGLNIKQIGRILSLMIIYEEYRNISYEDLASLWNIKYTQHKKMTYKVRNALKELVDFVEYDEIILVNKKEGVHVTKLPLRLNTLGGAFTQVYSGLIFYPVELITLFTTLEYFKGNSRVVNPSITTLSKLCGCSPNKVRSLLKDYTIQSIDTQGLWKVDTSKGRTTNYYKLSYTNENNEEIYYLSEAFKEGDKTFELPNSIKYPKRVLKRKNRPPREYVEEHENETHIIGVWA